MKSDCTHRLNKGEATRGDIALSLSKVMADKVGEFLIRAKIRNGDVVLIGGVTRNRHFLRFLSEAWPQTQFRLPAEATYFEAFGAAHLARALARPLAPLQQLVRPFQPAAGTPFAPLASADSRVTYHPSRRGALRPGAEYVLGVDGGSTTTKVALVDAETMEIAAAHYGRTHGDPVAALKRCLAEVQAQVNGAAPAHQPDRHHRVVARVARRLPGDGGRLQRDHRARGRHDVLRARRRHAVRDRRPGRQVRPAEQRRADRLRHERGLLGRHRIVPGGVGRRRPAHRARRGHRADRPRRRPRRSSSASTARRSSTATSARPSRAAPAGRTSRPAWCSRSWPTISTALSATARSGTRIALQGGVAKNPAVPLAFAQLVGKPVSVPPDPELMGCFGVARLALQKHREGSLGQGRVRPARRSRPRRSSSRASSRARRATTTAASATSPSTAGATRSAGAAPSSPAPGGAAPADERAAVDHVAWRTEELFTRSVPRAGGLPAAIGPGGRRAARPVGALALAVLRALLPRPRRADRAVGPRAARRASRGRKAATASRSRLPMARSRTCSTRASTISSCPTSATCPRWSPARCTPAPAR